MLMHNNNPFVSCLLALLCLMSAPVAAGVIDGIEQPPLVAENAHETEKQASNLHFRFFPESDPDHHLKDILESSGIFSRLESQFKQNFKFTSPIYFHIQHVKESQLIETEIEPGAQVVILPYSFLYTLFQGLSTKYDQQSEIINHMFAATAEFYIWSEAANIILKQQQLEIQGKTSTALDNFASIMMLNQNTPSGDYLVDAAEAYLLIHSLLSSSDSDDVQNELESDQKRYKHILCLTVGFDQLTQAEESGQDHLPQFALSPEQIELCQRKYLDIMQNWYQALTPVLQEDNVLNYWLHQETLLKPASGN